MGALGGLRIRLARFGFVRRPFFVMVVQEKRSPRNSGARLEDVGWWDPNPSADGNQHLGIKEDRIKYWLTAGAVPSSRVLAILERLSILPPRPRPRLPRMPRKEDATKWRADLKDK